jgi:hypothetical protein
MRFSDVLRSVRGVAAAAALLALSSLPAAAQTDVDEEQLGAWYMLFWNTSFGDGPFGLQGDVQYRNWDLGGDLEQLLLRGGVTWNPEGTGLTLTGGFAHITSGEFGEGDETISERRTYQEALLRQSLGSAQLRHRYRVEQRWVENQDFRTRYRYALFVDVPLNGKGNAGPGAVYLAFYDEVFINGERGIGDGRRVQLFDRNRLYGALGLGIADRARVQAGYMVQTLPNASKGQLQVSLHATF